jgi:hypothetical protein
VGEKRPKTVASLGIEEGNLETRINERRHWFSANGGITLA